MAIDGDGLMWIDVHGWNLLVDGHEIGWECKKMDHHTRRMALADKPTCGVLHLHSLDLAADLVGGATSAEGKEQQQEINLIDTMSRPSKASTNEEYAVVRETSDDYLALRRILLMSPLLNQRPSSFGLGDSTLADHLASRSLAQTAQSPTFEGSIFKQMLDELTPDGLQLGRAPTGSGGQASLHANGELGALAESTAGPSGAAQPATSGQQVMASSLEQLGLNLRNNSGRPWQRFNQLLLRFLNSYSSQLARPTSVEELQKGAGSGLGSLEGEKLGGQLGGQLGRREKRGPQARAAQRVGSVAEEQEQSSGAGAPSGGGRRSAPGGPHTALRSQYLTFACLAQDGNPLANLTFDWFFGPIRLPSLGQSSESSLRTGRQEQGDRQELEAPVLVHSSPNASLQILLARRLDTSAQLSPFQLSLLTLNVVLAPSGGSQAGQQLEKRDSKWTTQFSERPARHAASSGHLASLENQQQTGSLLAQALASSLQATSVNNNINRRLPAASQPLVFEAAASQSSLGGGRKQMRAAQLASLVEQLDELNWEHQLGQLLGCSVSSQLGASDTCPALVNVAERSRRVASARASSSLYEFARWHMPSLAQKSLLIISLLVGCTLILFLTFALLLGPQLQLVRLAMGAPKSPAAENGGPTGSAAARSAPEGNRSAARLDHAAISSTVMSSGSQKSSMLGLLGSGTSSNLSGSGSGTGAGSSFHGSSDDSDNSSTRLNQQQRATSGLLDEREQRRSANLTSRKPQTLAHEHAAGQAVGGLGGPKLVYRPNKGAFKLVSDSYSSENNYNQSVVASGTLQGGKLASAWRHPFGSTGDRILASLRLRRQPTGSSKSCASKMLDGSTISSCNLAAAAELNLASCLHSRNLSELTETTGLSGSPRETRTGASEPADSFGRPNWRHSYAGLSSRFSRPPPPTGRPPNPSRNATNLFQGGQQLYRLDEGQANRDGWSSAHNSDTSAYATNRLLQLNSQSLLAAAHERMLPPNAMDDFLRQRGIETSPHEDKGSLYARQRRMLFANRPSSMVHQPTNFLSLHNNNNLSMKPELHGNTSGSNMPPPVYPRKTNLHQFATMYNRAAMVQPQLSINREDWPQGTSTGGSQFYSANMLARDPNSAGYQYELDQTSSMQQMARQINGSFVTTGSDNLMTNRVGVQAEFAYANGAHGEPAQNYGPFEGETSMQSSTSPGYYNNMAMDFGLNPEPIEHIYDLNAYATPEQTPLRQRQLIQPSQDPSRTAAPSLPFGNYNQPNMDQNGQFNPRPRVSQLIQSFDTKISQQQSENI